MHLNRYVIVVGMDFSDLGNRAFRQAYELASLRPASEIHAISVMPGALVQPARGYEATERIIPPKLEDGVAQLTVHVNALLTKLNGSADATVHVFSHFRIDAPFLGITRLASELDADLIVVGTHGRHGIARWLLGSVAEGVVRHGNCPVLVIPPEATVPELPKIAAPCLRCVEARKLSNGRELWCAQHCERHGQRHTYHQRDRMSEEGSLPLVGR